MDSIPSFQLIQTNDAIILSCFFERHKHYKSFHCVFRVLFNSLLTLSTVYIRQEMREYRRMQGKQSGKVTYTYSVTFYAYD